MCCWVTSDDACLLYLSCNHVFSAHGSHSWLPNRSYTLSLSHLAVVLSLSSFPSKEDGGETDQKNLAPVFWFIWEMWHGKRKSFILGQKCQIVLWWKAAVWALLLWIIWADDVRTQASHLFKSLARGRIVMKQFFKNTPVVLDLITRHVRRDTDPSGFTIRPSKNSRRR